MTLKTTLAAMARPLSLILEDKALLPEPLLAVALYDFEGETEMAELTFAKGQMLRIFCEDFGASWSLAMLVDAQGCEIATDDKDGDTLPTLTRGLVAQGFYEYVSEPSLDRHHPSSTDSRDIAAPPEEVPSSPAETILAGEGTRSHQPNDEEKAETEDAIVIPLGVSPQTTPAEAALDVSADYLDDSTIESSLIVVIPSEQLGRDAPAYDNPQNPVIRPPAATPDSIASLSVVDLVGATVNEIRQVAPLTVPSAGCPAPRTRQTSTNSLIKSSNPVEAYLHSDLPYEPQDSLDKRDVIEIEEGKWISKIPPFHVAVPSYSQRRVAGGRGEYTVFQIVSSIAVPSRHSQAGLEEDRNEPDSAENRGISSHTSEMRQITVDRRYTHFQHLHTILKASLPLITIPDLPEKRLTGNFNPEFLHSRRRDLGRYLSRLARHNIIRSNKAFLDFLGSENEEAYDANLPCTLMNVLRTEPERFFTRIKHDSEYFDEHQLLEEVVEEHDRMARHVRAVEKGQGTSAIYDGLSQYRERLQGTGAALSDIALSLISLVSGLAQPKGGPVTTDEQEAQPEHVDRTRRRRERAKAHNMQNKDGAFCWRETCSECLSTTKAVQEAAEAMSLVADLYDANARTVLLAPQEQLIEYSLPRQRYQTLLSNTKLAQDYLCELLKKEEEEAEAQSDAQSIREGEKKRGEVVLNSLLAEIEQVHTERREDLQKFALTLLNGQIAFHERVLVKLQAARSAFQPSQLEELAHQGPRLPSILEKAVLDPSKARGTLPKASSFGLPAAPQSATLRPITSLVSTLFSGAVGLSGSWRSAISAIKAQTPTASTAGPEDLRERLGSPSLASSSRFVQFLDWTMNSRGEQRQYA